ncbi:hypothetical protein HPP92_003850 [Vanilla planifolia]|uniref:Uncharacterized protein n=1 Tax=Vanilla planifolia TaxID=51239 RepID=A0A835SHH9_VANPL|nr:hypothetical protein HPP92_003850 [Vanilla planifolia]
MEKAILLRKKGKRTKNLNYLNWKTLGMIVKLKHFPIILRFTRPLPEDLTEEKQRGRKKRRQKLEAKTSNYFFKETNSSGQRMQQVLRDEGKFLCSWFEGLRINQEHKRYF